MERKGTGRDLTTSSVGETIKLETMKRKKGKRYREFCIGSEGFKGINQ